MSQLWKATISFHDNIFSNGLKQKKDQLFYFKKMYNIISSASGLRSKDLFYENTIFFKIISANFSEDAFETVKLLCVKRLRRFLPSRRI